MIDQANETDYVCQTCSAVRPLRRHPRAKKFARERRARCISEDCRGRKRRFVVARRPLTGDYR